MLAPDSFVHTDTLIIGAGQAGLAAAYFLQQAQVSSILLEQAPTIGAQWASRYDSLRLFSPAWASGLPGLPWPGSQRRYPTKDEAAAYLRRYAAHFGFDVRLNEQVVRLRAAGPYAFEVTAASGTRYAAQRVIVCTGGLATPKIPAWASALAPDVLQLHSSAYQRPGQLPGTGPVAVVGSGNSAVQIAADVAATGRPVYIAYDERTKAMPNNTLMWVTLQSLGLLQASRHGLVGGFMHGQPEPVVADALRTLRRFTNAHFIGRATGVAGASIEGQRRATPPLRAVVWATGFRPDYSWIELPIIQADGLPRHHRGLSEPAGLAFLGLPWLDSRGSALMGGVAHDARRVVKQLLRAESAVERKKGN
ncbi:flavin-containing monooxygenase [Hymenobacter sp. CRA2]|uniref:flavin-containing monooxygenase n=1 Tax=Hymenobacter sp. CRA2 TaxID=1955620 RepID=UPI00098F567F|nr:NAD(P)/FAD-dependent oxidoreductase [Hymenobacter sp. CRA2]OON67831.1 hypothetical protein B0919_16745 [Hymenobacter sp. CRA2]